MCIIMILCICIDLKSVTCSILETTFTLLMCLNHLLATIFGFYKIKLFKILQTGTKYVECVFPIIKYLIILFACTCAAGLVANIVHITRCEEIPLVSWIRLIYILLYLTINSFIMHVVRSFKTYSNSADNTLKFQIESNLFIVPVLFYSSFVMLIVSIVSIYHGWGFEYLGVIFDFWINNLLMHMHIYGYHSSLRTLFTARQNFDKREATHMIGLPGWHPVRVTRDDMNKNSNLRKYVISDEDQSRQYSICTKEVHRRPDYDDHERRSEVPERDFKTSIESEELSREFQFYE